MTSRLFPFYISSTRANVLARRWPSFLTALEREEQFKHLTALEISGCVEANKTLTLVGWSSADNGFIQQCGTFWKQEVELTDVEFNQYVDIELRERAAADIAAEEEAKLGARIDARAAALRKELL